MPFSRNGRSYPSDLTDEQWKRIQKHIPSARRGGRPRTTDLREVINAVFYVSRSGIAWRYLPKRFPPWQTVYEYFSIWVMSGTWKQVHDRIRDRVRINCNKSPAPSTLIIDSQSIKAARGADRGYDGFKGIRGRKRHILVDTLGLIHSVVVHRADMSDTKSGHLVFEKPCCFSSLERIYADRGYRGSFISEMVWRLGIKPIVPRKRTKSGQGIRKTNKQKLANRKLRGITKKRWIVERTFSWFNHYRRLSKDYERKVSNSQAMIYISMTQLMLGRV